MRVYDQTWLLPAVARDMRRVAAYGEWDGRGPVGYFRRCVAGHAGTGTRIIFTRDVNHHLGGWWKNPEYERCRHLSLSFFDPTTLQPAPRDKALTARWLEVFFGDDRTKLWCEPPFSPEGKAREVWHYRLFCDEHWRPIVPRGEVYTREFTEAGWKSWSDVQADLSDARQELLERLADPPRKE